MDSLIGIIPDDWAEQRLSEVCDILAGPSTAKIAPAPQYVSDDVPVVTSKDLRHNRIADLCATSVSHEVAAELPRYRLLPDDIVCARTGHLDRHAIVNNEQRGWLIGPACFRLRVHRTISARYLIQYLGHPLVRDWLIRNASSSAIPTLSTEMLGSLPVVAPEISVQELVAEVLGALDDKVVIHERISRATAALRDAVLLRLLTRADSARPLDGCLFS
jgi:hypothetical protein